MIYSGKHIFDMVIGPNGILRTKARIFVTHGIHYLSKTDSIVMMRDGRIIEQGHFDSLMRLKSELFNLITEFGQQEESVGDVTDEQEVSSPTTLETHEIDEAHVVHSSEETVSQLRERRVSVTSLHRRPSLIAAEGRIKQDKEIGKDGLITKEEMAKGRVSWEVYAAYAKSCGIGPTMFCLILMIISQGIQVGKCMIL
jgi:ABC-type proline/glycine betaine transport system ATPase subunit